MDDLTKEQRTKNMRNIHSSHTKPEDLVGKYLFSKGLRYRRNDKRYPGKPDFALPKYDYLKVWDNTVDFDQIYSDGTKASEKADS